MYGMTRAVAGPLRAGEQRVARCRVEMIVPCSRTDPDRIGNSEPKPQPARPLIAAALASGGAQTRRSKKHKGRGTYVRGRLQGAATGCTSGPARAASAERAKTLLGAHWAVAQQLFAPAAAPRTLALAIPCSAVLRETADGIFEPWAAWRDPRVTVGRGAPEKLTRVAAEHHGHPRRDPVFGGGSDGRDHSGYHMYDHPRRCGPQLGRLPALAVTVALVCAVRATVPLPA